MTLDFSKYRKHLIYLPLSQAMDFSSVVASLLIKIFNRVETKTLIHCSSLIQIINFNTAFVPVVYVLYDIICLSSDSTLSVLFLPATTAE